MNTIEDIVKKLEELSNPEEIEGMARFGINPKNTYGIRMPVLKSIAKECEKSHKLAAELWEIDTRETKIIASLVDIPNDVTPLQMDNWANEFDYWEICDQCCINLFRKTEFAYDKIYEWTKNDKEFVKRAGFALIAVLAVHDKKTDNEIFENLLKLTKREACDNRNFVKKAVNWALRQIGKKNTYLNKKSIEIAIEIDNIDCKSAKWIAKDALRELKSEKVQKAIVKKEEKLKKSNLK
ncbi:MAG: DNA alkylation repair protein [Methanobrevibacter sp.]|nr:DNA alkylation repair protein [Methanobrevibacter sp.]